MHRCYSGYSLIAHCMQTLQDHMQILGLPVTIIYPRAFLENFFKHTLFTKQLDGTIFWSSNQNTDKKPWHSCHATGTAVLGELVCQCTVSCFWQCKRLAVLVHACCSLKLDACMSQYIRVTYVHCLVVSNVHTAQQRQQILQR